jgi:hypothetical protein
MEHDPSKPKSSGQSLFGFYASLWLHAEFGACLEERSMSVSGSKVLALKDRAEIGIQGTHHPSQWPPEARIEAGPAFWEETDEKQKFAISQETDVKTPGKQGILRDDRGQTQPADKQRAQQSQMEGPAAYAPHVGKKKANPKRDPAKMKAGRESE